MTQGRYLWALLCIHDKFTLTYRNGSKYTKPDTLSRIYDLNEERADPENILTDHFILGALRWEIEKRIEEAQEAVTIPIGCPPGKFRDSVTVGVLTTTRVMGFCVQHPHASATGRSPLMSAYGYQPPVFPLQEGLVEIPSVQLLFQRTHKICRETRGALSCYASRNIEDRRRRPTPEYQVGKKVRLSTWDLHLAGTARKLGPRFKGPFEVEAIINPVFIKLRLLPSMKVHPVFHVSLLKPVPSSLLSPSPTPSPPPQVFY